MRLGHFVYFKHLGELKKGFVSKELLNDEIAIMCDGVEYIRKAWEIAKVKNEN